MVFKRKFKEDKGYCTQAIFTTKPHLSEYPTKDIFTPHPSKPHLWRYSGRADDVIMLFHGPNVQPQVAKSQLMAKLGADTTAAVCLVGQGKRSPTLIVEAVSSVPLSKVERREHLDFALWPKVDAAKTNIEVNEQVFPSRIILTDPSDPIPRSYKGGPDRKAVQKKWGEEIDALYFDT